MNPLTAIGILIFAPGAPVPAPGPVIAAADRGEAVQMASVVYVLARNVSARYMRPVTEKELVEAAIRGMYEEVGKTVPAEISKTIRDSEDPAVLLNTLVEARVALGNPPSLAGPRAMIAAIGGFRHATDPWCGLVNPSRRTVASIDMDFQVGLELDGVSGTRWLLYLLESRRLTGAGVMVPPGAGIGPPGRVRDIPSPATMPWMVKKVVPGSPAQRAGVKPGDQITHVGGSEITPASAASKFTQFAFPSSRTKSIEHRLRIRREGVSAPISVTLTPDSYLPESVFGVMRTSDTRWDCLLDRENKIGYIRMGMIENRGDEKLSEMLANLAEKKCRGLILDLRWCPGGYVIEISKMVGMFLKEGALITRLDSRTEPLPGREFRAEAGSKYLDLPLVVLVGPETEGGGELIAAALQDHGRAVICGQRTFGRATISNMEDAGIAGLQYKLTTGISTRPSGKQRQRNPNSQPGDDWGVRPTPGFEVPVTRDLAEELGRWAVLHSLRTAESWESLPFDDPSKDPARIAALGYLRKNLAEKK